MQNKMCVIVVLLMSFSAILFISRPRSLTGILRFNALSQLVNRPGMVHTIHEPRGFAKYSTEVTERFKALAARKAPAHDPDLIRLLRAIIDPPSNRGPIKIPHRHQATAQCLEVDNVLSGKVSLKIVLRIFKCIIVSSLDFRHLSQIA